MKFCSIGIVITPADRTTRIYLTATGWVRAPHKRRAPTRVGAVMVGGFINLTFHGIGEPIRPPRSGAGGSLDTSRAIRVAIGMCQGSRRRHEHLGRRQRVGCRLRASGSARALAERHGLRGLGPAGGRHFLDKDGIRALAVAWMEIGCHGKRDRRGANSSGRRATNSRCTTGGYSGGRAGTRSCGRPAVRVLRPPGAADRTRILATSRSTHATAGPTARAASSRPVIASATTTSQACSSSSPHAIRPSTIQCGIAQLSR